MEPNIEVLEEIMKSKSLAELDHDEDAEDEDDDDNQMPFLLTNRIELEKRFKKLFNEFTEEKKLENRTELMSLLDEMLR